MENKKLEIMRAEKAEMYQMLRKRKVQKNMSGGLRYIPEEIKEAT